MRTNGLQLPYSPKDLEFVSFEALVCDKILLARNRLSIIQVRGKH